MTAVIEAGRFCETCRHWQTIIDGYNDPPQWAYCEMSKGVGTGLKMYCGEGGSLATMRDFGCVLHEPKDGGS